MTLFIENRNYTITFKSRLRYTNEQLFPRQVVIQLPKYVTHIIVEPRTSNRKEEQVTERNHNRLGTVSIKLLGRVLRVPNLALSFCYGSKHIVSCSVRVKVF